MSNDQVEPAAADVGRPSEAGGARPHLSEPERAIRAAALGVALGVFLRLVARRA